MKYINNLKAVCGGVSNEDTNEVVLNPELLLPAIVPVDLVSDLEDLENKAPKLPQLVDLVDFEQENTLN